MREPSGTTRIYEVDEDLALEGDAEIQRVTGVVRLLRTDKSVWVSADLDSKISCACSRCLREHWQPIHLIIEEEAYSLVDLQIGIRPADSEDIEKGFGIDQNHILDLTETAREYTALSMPMKPMCRSDCRGMCPGCGTNLNEFSCQCDRAVMGDLLDSLQGILPSNEETEVSKN